MIPPLFGQSKTEELRFAIRKVVAGSKFIASEMALELLKSLSAMHV